MDYRSNAGNQWLFAKRSPSEFYQGCNAGIYDPFYSKIAAFLAFNMIKKFLFCFLKKRP